MPVITVRGPTGPATSLRLDQDVITIGRSEENDLVLHDASSSRRHAEIRLVGEQWFVVDLGSRNGTLVRGLTVTRPTPVGAGDEIVIGSSVLTFGAEPGSEHVTDAWVRRAAAPGGSRRAEIVGRSPAITGLLRTLDRIAPSGATVLVTGESGTGKELVAEILHLKSPRREAPFVVVNCPALPGSLIESELFGVERGVATGVDEREGRIETAEGGTLFLDEVGDLELAAQAKLLRFMQERVIERVGGRTTRPVDARIVAATHHDLPRAVAAGRFRQDLYHRLAVVTLEVPPLRERREDIPILASHFLRRFAQGARELSPDALEALLAHDWPGNVRELEHALHQAHLLCAGDVICREDLPVAVRRPSASPVGEETRARGVSDAETILARLVARGDSFWDAVAQPFLRREMSREQVRDVVALAHAEGGGSYKGMARLLGMEAEHKKLLDFLHRHDLGVRR